MNKQKCEKRFAVSGNYCRKDAEFRMHIAGLHKNVCSTHVATVLQFLLETGENVMVKRANSRY